MFFSRRHVRIVFKLEMKYIARPATGTGQPSISVENKVGPGRRD